MEMLYRLKRDYEKNHEASEISILFQKACEQMYQQMKGNSVSVERLETLDAQIKELEEKLLSAADRRKSLEYKLFQQLRGALAEARPRILFMADGKLVEEGTPEAIFTHPQSPRLQDFLAKVL